MKILHTVESYDPVSHGMQQVVKQLSERLFQMGHDVTIATKFHPLRKSLVVNGVKIEQFKISGKAVGGYVAEKGEIQRYQELLINSDFDIVTNFAAQQWATDISLPILKQIKAKKVFVPTGFSGIYDPKFSDYFVSMKTWMQDYDMNSFLSDNYQDIDFARENGIKKIVLIPNGAATEEFEASGLPDIRLQLGIPNNHKLILNVGSHTGLKGHAEAIKIFKKAKLSNVTFLIIGNHLHGESFIVHFLKFFLKTIIGLFSKKRVFPSCLYTCQWQKTMFKYSYQGIFQQKRLSVEGLTRQQTIAAYKAADLFLFPSNIECSPLVLFEAMAAKTPFLTTDVGNAKEIIAWTNAGKLLPTKKTNNGYGSAVITDSANMLEELLKDGALLNEMAENGYKILQQKFSWINIAKQYEKLYSELLGKK